MLTKLTWNRRERARVSGSTCLVTRYPGRPILTAHMCMFEILKVTVSHGNSCLAQKKG